MKFCLDILPPSLNHMGVHYFPDIQSPVEARFSSLFFHKFHQKYGVFISKAFCWHFNMYFADFSDICKVRKLLPYFRYVAVNNNNRFVCHNQDIYTLTNISQVRLRSTFLPRPERNIRQTCLNHKIRQVSSTDTHRDSKFPKNSW